jgi:hypothetical protein
VLTVKYPVYTQSELIFQIDNWVWYWGHLWETLKTLRLPKANNITTLIFCHLQVYLTVLVNSTGYTQFHWRMAELLQISNLRGGGNKNKIAIFIYINSNFNVKF